MNSSRALLETVGGRMGGGGADAATHQVEAVENDQGTWGVK